MPSANHYDVVIVGGGPAGSTAGTLLKKYNPGLSVLILEREKFPRDHVGESQLPPISKILHEMGCWDKVEAADFPIKIGATYKWGASPELWDFEFLPAAHFVDEQRPAKFEGQRLRTAFQVDRAVYDDILLNHAAETGCEVCQETKVTKVSTTGKRVDGLTLESGETITARHYMDASGHSGIIRRALGVETDQATSLQNIAIWDYWQNAEWAIEIGVGGTRVQVISVGYGWIWFIPLGPTRTSVGLIVPVQYYKDCGKKPQELYDEALQVDPRIRKLMAAAVSENNLSTTKDWSFISKEHCGENWFLIGESAGFADPILAAGMTIAHIGAMEAACTVLELDRGKMKADWLKEQFDFRQKQRIWNHVRFADYWYTANAQFSDLKEFTSKIAADNGYGMSPDEAWRWLAQGGFIEDTAAVGIAGFAIDQMRAMHGLMTEDVQDTVLSKNNVFKLNTADAKWQERPDYAMGKVTKYPCYTRNGKTLPLVGVLWMVVDMLERSSRLADILEMINVTAQQHLDDPEFMEDFILAFPNALEGMIADGWVTASYDPSQPLVAPPARNTGIYWNSDCKV